MLFCWQNIHLTKIDFRVKKVSISDSYPDQIFNLLDIFLVYILME